MQTVTTTVAGLGMRELTGGSGDPLVMLHHSFGNPGWMPIHEALAEHYTVHALDLPGYGGPGGSERPDWARNPRDLALLVGQWLRAKSLEPVELAGCGFGGWVAAELATMAPELLKRLILVGAAGLLPEQGRIYDQFLVSHSNYVQAAFSNSEAYHAIFSNHGDNADELPISDDTLVLWDMNREMTTRVAWKPYMYNRRLRPLLDGVNVPALVVWGDNDAVVPMECAHAYVEALPYARLEVVPDCGHAVDLEAPDSLAAIITSGTANSGGAAQVTESNAPPTDTSRHHRTALASPAAQITEGNAPPAGAAQITESNAPPTGAAQITESNAPPTGASQITGGAN